MPIDKKYRIIKVNLCSQFLVAKQFLPAMLGQGYGSWVTVASSLGYVGSHSLAAYCATKAAVISFHESLTAEVGGPASKIQTLLINPGQMKTPMFQDLSTPNEFLAPVINPLLVAQFIVDKLDMRSGGEFGLPFYSNLLGLMRVLPSGLYWIVRRLSGMDEAAKRAAFLETKAT